ncbi:MAG: 1-phosphofructokinase [Moorellaceae bacterium]
MITTITINAAIDKTYIVENFRLNAVFRVKQVLAQAGGKGLNVARVVKALGEEVVATGFVGGHSGRFIADSLEAEGIPGEFVAIKGESRICLNILDPVGKSQTELLEPGPEVTPEEAEKLKDKIQELARRSRVVVISGSLVPGLPDDYYARLIEVIRREGSKTILDTSGAALEEGLKARPYMVKPNLQEAESLAGRPLKSRDARRGFVKELLASGIEVAVLSLGGEGALIGAGKEFFKVVPPRVQVANTVGCGDAFVAGFAVALSRGEGVREAARWATAVASASATTLGTAQCDVNQVGSLLAGVTIEPV